MDKLLNQRGSNRAIAGKVTSVNSELNSFRLNAQLTSGHRGESESASQKLCPRTNFLTEGGHVSDGCVSDGWVCDGCVSDGDLHEPQVDSSPHLVPSWERAWDI